MHSHQHLHTAHNSTPHSFPTASCYCTPREVTASPPSFQQPNRAEHVGVPGDERVHGESGVLHRQSGEAEGLGLEPRDATRKAKAGERKETKETAVRFGSVCGDGVGRLTLGLKGLYRTYRKEMSNDVKVFFMCRCRFLKIQSVRVPQTHTKMVPTVYQGR